MKWPFIDPSKWQKASYGKITITKILNSKSIYIAAWLQESSTGQLNSQLKTICWKFIKKKTTAAKATTTTVKNNFKHKELRQKTNLPAETSIEPSNSTC